MVTRAWKIKYYQMLTDPQLAVSNMYSIARLYQRSLPPMSTSDLHRHTTYLSQLHLLHNFLCDASATIEAAERNERICSTDVTMGTSLCVWVCQYSVECVCESVWECLCSVVCVCEGCQYCVVCVCVSESVSVVWCVSVWVRVSV